MRGEEALVICWAALGFFAYSLLGGLVWEFGDGEIVEGWTNGIEGWSVSWGSVSDLYYKTGDGYIPVVILRCGQMQCEVVKMSR